MSREDYEEDAVAVWPCNQRAVAFFTDYCFTQWRMGPNGPTGLDRGVVLADLARLDLPKAEADDLYSRIREMERAALRKISETKR